MRRASQRHTGFGEDSSGNRQAESGGRTVRWKAPPSAAGLGHPRERLLRPEVSWPWARRI
eukprot:3613534-Pyramimonas_sp.AAC.1